jgi:hypothetical protein
MASAKASPDPDCAMAHWGIAYAVGPNYNFPWEMRDPDTKTSSLARAYDAALALADRVTAPERAFIQALPARFPQRDPIEDQRPWNVEAIMNCTPWQMWDLRTGAPADGAGTLEAQEVLDTAFRTVPGALRHPGLLHLHIHLMEMSQHPEAALQSGDRLRELAPDMGHLVHMPSTGLPDRPRMKPTSLASHQSITSDLP